MTPKRKPVNPCPRCGTAELRYGRLICQACSMLELYGAVLP